MKKICFLVCLVIGSLFTIQCSKKVIHKEKIYSDILPDLISEVYLSEVENSLLKNNNGVEKPLYFIGFTTSIDESEIELIKTYMGIDSLYLLNQNHIINEKLLTSSQYDLKKNETEGKINFDSIIGLISFSEIYFFDKKKKTGILHFKFLCGSLCGYESYIYIQKKKKNWIVVKKEIVTSY